MIAALNNKPQLCEFVELMQCTNDYLNYEAQNNQDYFSNRNGKLLEDDVFEALTKCSRGTPFEDSIEQVSEPYFPDIIAAKYYGVEVKSTKKNQWVSIGSSILESTRINSVERIFMTFGKLGKPVQFKSRPYEECLRDIAVTHYPRYKIDMRTKPGESIFDKMGIPYDVLRQLDNPVEPVSKYYQNQLNEGERLWWASGESIASSPILRLWNNISPKEKLIYLAKGCVLFPELTKPHDTKKYQRFALWLVTDCNIVNTNVRDLFSAGGRADIVTNNGVYRNQPKIFCNINLSRSMIARLLMNTEKEVLESNWEHVIVEDPIVDWCEIVASYQDISKYHEVLHLLHTIFDL